jgi:hypothetical protein
MSQGVFSCLLLFINKGKKDEHTKKHMNHLKKGERRAKEPSQV